MSQPCFSASPKTLTTSRTRPISKLKKGPLCLARVNPGVSPWKLMRMGERTTLHSIMSLGSHSWWLSQSNSKKIPVKHIHLPNKKCDKYHHLAPLYDCLEKFTSRVVIFLDKKKGSPALSNPKKIAESLLESCYFVFLSMESLRETIWVFPKIGVLPNHPF